MPIQTSTQVRTVQTTDLGVVKHPAMDLLASNVSVQGKNVLVDVVRLQACTRVSLERKEIVKKTKRSLASARTTVELTALGSGLFLVFYGIQQEERTGGPGLSGALILYGSIGALASLIVFAVDNARAFEKTERGNLFIQHTAPSFVCEQKPEKDADVLLRFPDGNSLRETTGLDGRAIFPAEHIHPLLQRNQGHVRPWINGQPHPAVTLPPDVLAR
jgi:hypothetical protein